MDVGVDVSTREEIGVEADVLKNVGVDVPVHPKGTIRRSSPTGLIAWM